MTQNVEIPDRTIGMLVCGIGEEEDEMKAEVRLPKALSRIQTMQVVSCMLSAASSAMEKIIDAEAGDDDGGN